MYILGLSGR
uniref:Uncharacterized protein n=1 Tax=Arundo donax TaxID=35708 RepID=A0A0A9CIN8_ARUDO